MNFSSPRSTLALAALLGLSLVACSSGGGGDDGDDGGAADCGDILVGDLVITEVMANPTGEDRGNEYFEVYNADSGAIDASAFTLVYSLPDGSNEETHDVGDLVIEPGDYVTLGAVAQEEAPEFVDYGFDNDLGSLRNGGALLSLRCGDQVIDQVEYASAEGQDGVAWGLDGAMPPNHLINDDPANFCPATIEFASGMFGSPGAANEPCTPVFSGTCTDGDGERDLVVPAVGDLVITEFMASPAGSDDTQEWFEVYANKDVDLNGLVAGRVVGEPTLTIEQPDCLSLTTGQYAVFARSAEADNGGIEDVIATFGFSLVGEGSMFIGIGDTVLDQIVWTSAADGASTALDPELLDPKANDDEANWTTCTAPYGDAGNTGTPGTSNEDCGGGGGEGTCLDGGKPRPIVSPTAGQILVTEALANPLGTGPEIDPGHEWFEITALADFDLNGLELGNGDTVDQTLNLADCESVSDGTRIVFAHQAKDNGGLPQVNFPKTFQLTNSGGLIFVGVGGTVLHTFDYGNAADGRTRQLDPDGVTVCTTPETVPYGDGDLGTPGAANPACP